MLWNFFHVLAGLERNISLLTIGYSWLSVGCVFSDIFLRAISICRSLMLLLYRLRWLIKKCVLIINFSNLSYHKKIKLMNWIFISCQKIFFFDLMKNEYTWIISTYHLQNDKISNQNICTLIYMGKLHIIHPELSRKNIEVFHSVSKVTIVSSSVVTFFRLL